MDDFLMVGLDPNRKWQIFNGGQRNVGLMCKKNVALRCGCSIPAAE